MRFANTSSRFEIIDAAHRSLRDDGDRDVPESHVTTSETAALDVPLDALARNQAVCELAHRRHSDGE